MTTTETGNGGVTIDQTLNTFFEMIRVQEDKDGKIVDPNTERAEAVNTRIEVLRKTTIDDILHGSKTADETAAKSMVYKLSLELAKTYGADIKNLPEDRRNEYLSIAFRELGIPGVNSPDQLAQSIMNMPRPGAKPNDPLYDANSALVQLMQYVAGRQEEDQGKFAAKLTELLNKYQSPKDAMQIVEGLKHRGVKIGPTATAAQFQTSIREYQAEQTRKYIDSLPKTYHNGGSVAGAGAPAQAAHMPKAA